MGTLRELEVLNIRTALAVGEEVGDVVISDVVVGDVVVDDVVVSDVIVDDVVASDVVVGDVVVGDVIESLRNPVSYTCRRHELPQNRPESPVHGELHSSGSVGINLSSAFPQ